MGTSFVPNQWMAFAGLPLLPVLLWFLHRRQTARLFLFGGLLFLVFSKGTLEILGLSTTITRLMAEVMILVIFCITFVGISRPLKRFPGLFLLMAFMALAFLSVYYSKANFVLLFLFYRDYLFIFLFLYSVLNTPFNRHEAYSLMKLLVFLSLAQIAANIIKYFVMGTIMEPYIGTMGNLGGSLSIIFALVGSAICIALYLNIKKTRYLVVLLGFILFSLLGGKRATIVYVPFLYLSMLMIYQKYQGISLKELLKQASLLLMVSITLVYFSVRLMPTLNPERVVWGTFDLGYAMDYSTNYLTTGSGAIEIVGRSEAPGYLISMVAADSLGHLLMGYGAGHLAKSRFNPAIVNYGSMTNLTKALYGVGYGARTAFLQLFLQIGMCGVFFYTGTWICIYRSVIRAQRHILPANVRNMAALVVSGLFCVFTIDFFTYSVVMVKISSASLAFCLVIAFLRDPALVSSFLASVRNIQLKTRPILL